METVSQRFLSAAIKLVRPPNHCVVFAADPTAITGAALGATRALGPAPCHACLLPAPLSPPLPLIAPLTSPLRPSQPTPSAAAHNCTMKAVAVMGTHQAFKLKNADLTCASMRELSVYNIRWGRRWRRGGGGVCVRRGRRGGGTEEASGTDPAKVLPVEFQLNSGCLRPLPRRPQAPVRDARR